MSLRAMLLICLANTLVLPASVRAIEEGIPPAPVSEEEGHVDLFAANLEAAEIGVGTANDVYRSCDCCDQGRCRHGLCGRFLNLLEPSDTCFEDFISPTSNLLFFEDPRQLTEARFVFLNHRIPDDIFGGWELQTIGVQLRARLTDRLSLIATKDGFIMQQPDSIADDGWADVALGLKYSLFRDPERQRLWSVGFTYELPVGSRRALQGNGDGEFHLFLSGGRQIGCHAHWLTGLGIRLPSNHHDRSQMVYWSNHFDYEVVDDIYGFFEVNWFHWTRSGDNAATNGIAGFDLLNLGSTGVAGLDVVTLAAGATMKLRCYDELSVGYEFPVSEEEDIIRDRFYLTYSLRY